MKSSAKKVEKSVDKRVCFEYNIPCQQRAPLLTNRNNGDLHSGSAVDSDSTCGSSILSSPTSTAAEKLRYFRGIAQLVARFVRDEEAVGSNPAAPTKKDQIGKGLSGLFLISAAGPLAKVQCWVIGQTADLDIAMSLKGIKKGKRIQKNVGLPEPSPKGPLLVDGTDEDDAQKHHNDSPFWPQKTELSVTYSAVKYYFSRAESRCTKIRCRTFWQDLNNFS